MVLKTINKIVTIALVFTLIFEQSGFAQVLGPMAVPAYINGYVAADRFRPLQLRSLTFNLIKNDFELYLDKGDLSDLQPSEIKENAAKLSEYFQTGLRLPNKVFWVNLRPDKPEEMIESWLENTDLGKVMLESDLKLKKDMANFTSPETAEGKSYWDNLYKKAEEIYGQEEISIPTLTRPWIVPGEILIRESKDNAYIYKATLKVMLEQDYLKNTPEYKFDDPRAKQLNDYSTELIRQDILPKLTREVNSSKKYAELRQVYYSLILAQWVKQKSFSRGIKDRRLDSFDLTGLTSHKRWSKDTYFKAYKKSFARGEYRLQENVSRLGGMSVRQYTSGGEQLVVKPEMIGAVTRSLDGGLPAHLSAGMMSVRLDGEIERASSSERFNEETVSRDGGVRIKETAVKENVIVRLANKAYLGIFGPSLVKKDIEILNNAIAVHIESEKAAEELGKVGNAWAVEPLKRYLVKVVLGDNYDMAPSAENSLRALGLSNRDMERIYLRALDDQNLHLLIRINSAKVLGERVGRELALSKLPEHSRKEVNQTVKRAIDKAIVDIVRRLDKDPTAKDGGDASSFYGQQQVSKDDIAQPAGIKAVIKNIFDKYRIWQIEKLDAQITDLNKKEWELEKLIAESKYRPITNDWHKSYDLAKIIKEMRGELVRLKKSREQLEERRSKLAAYFISGPSETNRDDSMPKGKPHVPESPIPYMKEMNMREVIRELDKQEVSSKLKIQLAKIKFRLAHWPKSKDDITLKYGKVTFFQFAVTSLRLQALLDSSQPRYPWAFGQLLAKCLNPDEKLSSAAETRLKKINLLGNDGKISESVRIITLSIVEGDSPSKRSGRDGGSTEVRRVDSDRDGGSTEVRRVDSNNDDGAVSIDDFSNLVNDKNGLIADFVKSKFSGKEPGLLRFMLKEMLGKFRNAGIVDGKLITASHTEHHYAELAIAFLKERNAQNDGGSAASGAIGGAEAQLSAEARRVGPNNDGGVSIELNHMYYAAVRTKDLVEYRRIVANMGFLVADAVRNTVKNKRLMIVDDSPLIRRELLGTYTRFGFTRIEFARDALEGLEKYKKALEEGNSFDIVSTDHSMPTDSKRLNKNGLWLAGEIRKIDASKKNIPILWVSGSDPEETAAKVALSRGEINRIIRKPTMEAELALAILELFGTEGPKKDGGTREQKIKRLELVIKLLNERKAKLDARMSEDTAQKSELQKDMDNLLAYLKDVERDLEQLKATPAETWDNGRIEKGQEFRIKGNSEYFKELYGTANPIIVIEGPHQQILGGWYGVKLDNMPARFYLGRMRDEHLPGDDPNEPEVFAGTIYYKGGRHTELVHKSELEAFEPENDESFNDGGAEARLSAEAIPVDSVKDGKTPMEKVISEIESAVRNKDQVTLELLRWELIRLHQDWVVKQISENRDSVSYQSTSLLPAALGRAKEEGVTRVFSAFNEWIEIDKAIRAAKTGEYVGYPFRVGKNNAQMIILYPTVEGLKSRYKKKGVQQTQGVQREQTDGGSAEARRVDTDKDGGSTEEDDVKDGLRKIVYTRNSLSWEGNDREYYKLTALFNAAWFGVPVLTVTPDSREIKVKLTYEDRQILENDIRSGILMGVSDGKMLRLSWNSRFKLQPEEGIDDIQVDKIVLEKVPDWFDKFTFINNDRMMRAKLVAGEEDKIFRMLNPLDAELAASERIYEMLSYGMAECDSVFEQFPLEQQYRIIQRRKFLRMTDEDILALFMQMDKTNPFMLDALTELFGRIVNGGYHKEEKDLIIDRSIYLFRDDELKSDFKKRLIRIWSELKDPKLIDVLNDYIEGNIFFPSQAYTAVVTEKNLRDEANVALSVITIGGPRGGDIIPAEEETEREEGFFSRVFKSLRDLEIAQEVLSESQIRDRDERKAYWILGAEGIGVRSDSRRASNREIGKMILARDFFPALSVDADDELVRTSSMRINKEGRIEILSNVVKKHTGGYNPVFKGQICTLSNEGEFLGIRNAEFSQKEFEAWFEQLGDLYVGKREGALGPFMQSPVLGRILSKLLSSNELRTYIEPVHGNRWLLHAYPGPSFKKIGEYHLIDAQPQNTDISLIFTGTRKTGVGIHIDAPSSRFQEIRQLPNGDVILILSNEMRYLDLSYGRTKWSIPYPEAVRGRVFIDSFVFDQDGNTWILYLNGPLVKYNTGTAKQPAEFSWGGEFNLSLLSETDRKFRDYLGSALAARGENTRIDLGEILKEDQYQTDGGNRFSNKGYLTVKQRFKVWLAAERIVWGRDPGGIFKEMDKLSERAELIKLLVHYDHHSPLKFLIKLLSGFDLNQNARKAVIGFFQGDNKNLRSFKDGGSTASGAIGGAEARLSAEVRRVDTDNDGGSTEVRRVDSANDGGSSAESNLDDPVELERIFAGIVEKYQNTGRQSQIDLSDEEIDALAWANFERNNGFSALADRFNLNGRLTSVAMQKLNLRMAERAVNKIFRTDRNSASKEIAEQGKIRLDGGEESEKLTIRQRNKIYLAMQRLILGENTASVVDRNWHWTETAELIRLLNAYSYSTSDIENNLLKRLTGMDFKNNAFEAAQTLVLGKLKRESINFDLTSVQGFKIWWAAERIIFGGDPGEITSAGWNIAEKLELTRILYLYPQSSITNTLFKYFFRIDRGDNAHKAADAIIKDVFVSLNKNGDNLSYSSAWIKNLKKKARDIRDMRNNKDGGSTASGAIGSAEARLSAEVRRGDPISDGGSVETRLSAQESYATIERNFRAFTDNDVWQRVWMKAKTSPGTTIYGICDQKGQMIKLSNYPLGNSVAGSMGFVVSRGEIFLKTLPGEPVTNSSDMIQSVLDGTFKGLDKYLDRDVAAYDGGSTQARRDDPINDGGKVKDPSRLVVLRENFGLQLKLFFSGIGISEIMMIMARLDHIQGPKREDFRQMYIKLVDAMILAGFKGTALEIVLDAVRKVNDREYSVDEQLNFTSDLVLIQTLMDISGVEKGYADGRHQRSILTKLVFRSDREKMASLLIDLLPMKARQDSGFISSVLYELVYSGKPEKTIESENIAGRRQDLEKAAEFLSKEITGRPLAYENQGMVFSRMLQASFGLGAVLKLIDVGQDNRFSHEKINAMISHVIYWTTDGYNPFAEKVIENLATGSREDNIKFVSRIYEEYEPLYPDASRESFRGAYLGALVNYLKPQDQRIPSRLDGGSVALPLEFYEGKKMIFSLSVDHLLPEAADQWRKAFSRINNKEVEIRDLDDYKSYSEIVLSGGGELYLILWDAPGIYVLTDPDTGIRYVSGEPNGEPKVDGQPDDEAKALIAQPLDTYEQARLAGNILNLLYFQSRSYQKYPSTLEEKKFFEALNDGRKGSLRVGNLRLRGLYVMYKGGDAPGIQYILSVSNDNRMPKSYVVHYENGWRVYWVNKKPDQDKESIVLVCPYGQFLITRRSKSRVKVEEWSGTLKPAPETVVRWNEVLSAEVRRGDPINDGGRITEKQLVQFSKNDTGISYMLALDFADKWITDRDPFSRTEIEKARDHLLKALEDPAAADEADRQMLRSARTFLERIGRYAAELRFGDETLSVKQRIQDFCNTHWTRDKYSAVQSFANIHFYKNDISMLKLNSDAFTHELKNDMKYVMFYGTAEWRTSEQVGNIKSLLVYAEEYLDELRKIASELELKPWSSRKLKQFRLKDIYSLTKEESLSKRGTVLVVEDSFRYQAVIAGYFTAKGFAVKTVETVSDAMREFLAESTRDQGGIVMISTDRDLGQDENGEDLARKIKGRVPVVIVSGGYEADEPVVVDQTGEVTARVPKAAFIAGLDKVLEKIDSRLIELQEKNIALVGQEKRSGAEENADGGTSSKLYNLYNKAVNSRNSDEYYPIAANMVLLVGNEVGEAIKDKRLLIVDDSKFMREILPIIYGKFGFTKIEVAKDALEGLEKYKKAIAEGQPFEIVSTDHSMPTGIETLDKDGLWLAGELRKIDGVRNVPILWVSGANPEKEGADTAMVRGDITRVIRKPRMEAGLAIAVFELFASVQKNGLLDRLHGMVWSRTVPPEQKQEVADELKSLYSQAKDGGENDDMGGIDFRALPQTITPMGNPAAAGQALISLKDLDKQWSDIQSKIYEGQMPYEEIKIYVNSCCGSKALCKQLEKVSEGITNILKMEEERAMATAPELKEILACLG